MSLAHALQARVSADINENKDNYFNDAMELLDDCLNLAQDIFGTMSFKVAQVHRLRSATYLSKKMLIKNCFFFFY
jgi:argininosuccinate lyase